MQISEVFDLSEKVLTKEKEVILISMFFGVDLINKVQVAICKFYVNLL